MRIFSKLNSKQIIQYIIVVIASIFIITLIEYIQKSQNSKEYLNVTFSGIIQKVEFSQKGFPIVRINDEDYYLDQYSNSFDNFIRRGDSIVKVKGSGDIIVFRKTDNIYLKRIFKIAQ